MWLIRVEKCPEVRNGFLRYEPFSSTLITNTQCSPPKKFRKKSLPRKKKFVQKKVCRKKPTKKKKLKRKRTTQTRNIHKWSLAKK